METLGQWLREKREARNISVEEIAAATKIVPRYLEALEADRLDLMPGGFFVKGIIRTYARAIGLDPEEVLERYRAAGLLAGPEHGRTFVPMPAGPTTPLIEPAPEAAPPRSRAGTEEPVAPAPPSAGNGESSLLFEDTAKSGPSADARKKILAWIWRGLAVLVVCSAVFVVLRAIRRSPRPRPEAATVVAETALPPAQKTEPVGAPATGPETETGAPAASQAAVAPPPGTGTPSVTEEVGTGLTIEITFQAETWIRVYADGDLKVDGLFPAGATARAQAESKILIHTGNAGGFTFLLNGRPAKPLGRSGQVLTDITITPENLKDFLEVPSSPSGRPPA